MNAKELADALNGIEYSATMHMSGSDLMKQAKAAGLVVAYGFSDDLLEFDGAIYDEAGAPGVVLVDEKGLLPDWDSLGEDEDECAYYLYRKPNAKSIEAVWSEEGSGYAWTLKTDIPHEVFSVMEDGEGISRGIVFALADLVPVPAGCQGTNCGTTDGHNHSPECVVEAAACQGWLNSPEAVDALLKAMVNRFLGWKLPADFFPDCGISFKSESDYEHPEFGRTKYEPVGTNLFTADQALQMFKHCLPAELIAAQNTVPDGMVQITTNGTTRTIPADEPVFLLRGQDRFAADAVRYWTFLVEENGGIPEMVRTAREHAAKMDAWPKKKAPDLPAPDHQCCGKCEKPADTRAEFEDWVRSVPFFAHFDWYDGLERDDTDNGYLDANVHAAWLAWNARGEA